MRFDTIIIQSLLAASVHSFAFEKRSCSTDSDCSDGRICSSGVCLSNSISLGFTSEGFVSEWNIVKDNYGTDTRAVVQDPLDMVDVVLQAKYPSGSRNPNGPVVGGFGLYANPIDLTNSNVVTFEYQVYFPEGFDFVLGGKMPGLYGGKTGCSGGDTALDCFSTRYMWRQGGDGEAYLYMNKDAQRKDMCDSDDMICNPDYGYSLGRGKINFGTGKWTSIRQTIKLNSFDASGNPESNGSITIWIDNNPVTSVNSNQLVFRVNPSITFTGIHMETFFGGGSDAFVTPKDQVSYFKGFKIYSE